MKVVWLVAIIFFDCLSFLLVAPRFLRGADSVAQFSLVSAAAC